MKESSHPSPHGFAPLSASVEWDFPSTTVGSAPLVVPQERSEGDRPTVSTLEAKPPSIVQMVVIVRRFAVPVESLSDPRCLPGVDELRPLSCPCCQEPARTEEGLRIVGYGTYERQVLGLRSGYRYVVILIRRFFCRSCRGTISVLPDELYPGRWYAGIAILMSLALSLLRGRSDGRLRRHITGLRKARDWKTLGRWRQQIFSPLWTWLARQTGSASAPPGNRQECARRLMRLLLLHRTRSDKPGKITGLARIARQLVIATAHDRAVGWEVRRGLPVKLSSQRPQEATT